MSTVVSIILALLKMANILLSYAQERQLMKAGADAEIAKASAAVLLKTESAKQIMQEVTAMTDKQVDAALKGLEP